MQNITQDNGVSPLGSIFSSEKSILSDQWIQLGEFKEEALFIFTGSQFYEIYRPT